MSELDKLDKLVVPPPVNNDRVTTKLSIKGDGLFQVIFILLTGTKLTSTMVTLGGVPGDIPLIRLDGAEILYTLSEQPFLAIIRK